MKGNKGAIHSMKGQVGRRALLKLSEGNSDFVHQEYDKIERCEILKIFFGCCVVCGRADCGPSRYRGISGHAPHPSDRD